MRLNKIRSLHACTNCLRQGHISKDYNSSHQTNPRNEGFNPQPKPSPNRQQINRTNSSDSIDSNSQALSVTNNHSPDSSYVLLSTADIVILDSEDKITSNLPEISFNSEALGIPKNISLADDNFNKPGPIDILLGASIFWKLICVGQILLSNTHAVLQKTTLGWIVSGSLPLSNGYSSICNLSTSSPSSMLHEQLEKFWKLEECQISTFYSQEEKECEEHFLDTVYRDKSGKFVVSLPLKDNISLLGESYDTALKRFYTVEKRLSKNEDLKSQYAEFMSEYEMLGHMSKVREVSSEMDDPEYFLPHHCVIKENSSTTKLRVVFDGSAKSSSGISLNDTLKIGPKLQDDLMDIVLLFRTNQFAFTADIEKMYRCVKVKESHRNLQKILWRSDPSQRVEQYKLNTVTYGTASASYLAIRSLQEVATQNKENFPKAAEKILSSFYVDDFLCGSNSISEGKKLISDVIHILETAGFHLRKWVANDPSLLNDILKGGSSNHKFISDDNMTKTLGLTWNAKEDIFQYSFHISPTNRITKRSILAVTAQIFDPLGLIGPCIIKAKLILQSLWHESSNVEFHGFSDASIKSYGACCYLKTTNHQGETNVSLVCAKSKVAPLKTISLPRLELCAAVLLARLAHRVLNSLRIKIDSFHYWTDSTIVLSWIALQPSTLNTFVANRISEIQTLTEVNQWSHVPSADNPADIISRGLEPIKLENCQLWWSGPFFLKQGKEYWPPKVNPSSDLPEVKEQKHTFVTHKNILSDELDLCEKFSSYTKLLRVTAYCLRFIKLLKQKGNKSQFANFICKDELQDARIVISKIVQRRYFSDEIKHLQNVRRVSLKSPLLRLNPFLDEKGLIRVGGRLNHCNLSYDIKHPILLPSNSYFSKLIILYEHHRHLHAGAQATLAAVRLRFWIINGRNTVQKILRKCVTCFKVMPKVALNQMGDLPKSRITPERPFRVTGMDFAGPFLVKDEDVRYIAENRLKHFKHLQQQVQHFWQRWSNITTLQERSKWHTRSANIEVGALVLVKDDNVPPLCWNLGRIVEVIPGDDNIVRVVCVKTKHGVLKRPIAKICALPFSDS
ncbi:uncharacterized protein LOC115887781 [Sitophilus oryzae]|uniref:Uncharacterized protein LOC115887781 n=1 Tax=Sitophilus oryzae TaxID=7048 RepID=A0A6J2YIA5_SITOR|nr:uncharacterized protein LOC115887781 [Sitophilus oryzae]